MKPINKLKKLKKGEKVKIKGEDYLIEDFKDKSLNDEKTGENAETKEIVLSKFGKNSKKLLRERYAVRYNKDKKTIQIGKVSEKGEKFKDGFSYEKNSAIMSYSGGEHEEDEIDDFENNEMEYEINDDEEDW